jgi:hypothetical protein
MRAFRNATRSQSCWLIALTLCGTLLGVTAPAQAADQQLGTVIGVSNWELEAFRRVNAIYGNNVTVLHVLPEYYSPVLDISSVSVTRNDTGGPAGTLYFPTYGNKLDGVPLDITQELRRINAFDSLSPAFIIGEGHTAIAKVEVLQSATGSFDPVTTRFLMLPGEHLDEIVAQNPKGKVRVVHRQRAQIGGTNREVILVAVEANGLLATDTATVDVPAPGFYTQSVSRLVQSLNRNVAPQGVAAPGTPTTLEVR